MTETDKTLREQDRARRKAERARIEAGANSMVLQAKLAAIVVHADELTGPGGHEFDATVLRGLIEADDVQGWLASLDPALLPVKRGE